MLAKTERHGNGIFTCWLFCASCRNRSSWYRVICRDRTPFQTAWLRCLSLEELTKYHVGWGNTFVLMDETSGFALLYLFLPFLSPHVTFCAGRRSEAEWCHWSLCGYVEWSAFCIRAISVARGECLEPNWASGGRPMESRKWKIFQVDTTLKGVRKIL